MEEKSITMKELKKRRMLIVLPLLTLPFITFLFWSLGGGKAQEDILENKQKAGFNIDLPLPRLKEDSALNKMSYYEIAVMDSLKLQDEIRNDPNYSDNLVSSDSLIHDDYTLKSNNKLRNISSKNENEVKVYEKLKALQKAIRKPAEGNENTHDMREFQNYASSDSNEDEVRGLERMMTIMNTPQEPDPELKQLGGMLENILDIQHPERVEEKLKQSSLDQKVKVFTVQKMEGYQNFHISSLENNIKTPQLNNNSFYSLDENHSFNFQQNAIEAVIHETQTIVNGSTVKIRICNSIIINGIQIPKNVFVFGAATLKGERLEIMVNTIKYGNTIFPVALKVFDMDAIDGIYIPGAISRDVAKSSADRSMQAVNFSGLNDSWTGQAAGMGVEAAKSLLSKKVKLIKVVVKAGYQVLLCDEKDLK
ncbi:conjugative transposon TraM protein [Flavobacterium sp. 9]|uniref:conjugative transposon protein TraM n=1 Tax=Flavobacterium sp. 9 TaxID=2035198 RepID=UPI000C18CBBD|nr:conjugative transposon protein TraM [Flavobacterium sp. 9]PIF34555.1 conjugative transposon TraM protein [Flavobacterium sp. 9]